MHKTMRVALLFLVAMIALNLFAMPTRSFADDQKDANEVSMLILYDDSYVCLMENYFITDPAERIAQMTKIATIPFEKTLSLDLSVTVLPYSTVLGTEYAKSCPDLYPSVPSIYERDHHEWALNAQCTCVPEEQCYNNNPNTCHHNSAYGLINRLYSYVVNSNYDYVALFVGHKLCYYSGGTHRYCGGMGQVGGRALVGIGYGDLQQSQAGNYQVLNLLSIKGILWHEFSHNLGLHDPATGYSSNEPCTMAGGFDGIIYAKKIWCSDCLSALTATGGDNIE